MLGCSEYSPQKEFMNGMDEVSEVNTSGGLNDLSGCM